MSLGILIFAVAMPFKVIIERQLWLPLSFWEVKSSLFMTQGQGSKKHCACSCEPPRGVIPEICARQQPTLNNICLDKAGDSSLSTSNEMKCVYYNSRKDYKCELIMCSHENSAFCLRRPGILISGREVSLVQQKTWDCGLGNHFEEIGEGNLSFDRVLLCTKLPSSIFPESGCVHMMHVPEVAKAGTMRSPLSVFDCLQWSLRKFSSNCISLTMFCNASTPILSCTWPPHLQSQCYLHAILLTL